MSQKRSDEELDSLLGRGSIGAARRDAIFDRVLEGVDRERQDRWRRRWILAGASTVAAAAMALLVLLPRSPSVDDAGFRAKGGSRPSSVKVECLDGALASCPAGSLLAVRAQGVLGYLSAWAEPSDGGERIWYFSADTSAQVEPGARDGNAKTAAVKIGPEHKPGTYTVKARVTEKPVSREEALHLPPNRVLAEGQFLLRVTSP